MTVEGNAVASQQRPFVIQANSPLGNVEERRPNPATQANLLQQNFADSLNVLSPLQVFVGPRNMNNIRTTFYHEGNLVTIVPNEVAIEHPPMWAVDP